MLILDDIAPLKTKTKRLPAMGTPLWLTESVKEANRSRRRLERRYKSSNCLQDYIMFRKAGRLVTKEITAAREDYYRRKMVEVGGDSKGVWRVAKSLLHTVQ